MTQTDGVVRLGQIINGGLADALRDTEATGDGNTWEVRAARLMLRALDNAMEFERGNIDPTEMNSLHGDEVTDTYLGLQGLT